jgi:hypothetical protein
VGPRDDLRDPFGRVELEHPLGERAEHRLVVDFLERLAAAHRARHLTDEEEQRRRVLEGRVHADRRVRRARPARDHADARPAGELAVGLSHVGCAGLVPARDEPERPVDERVEQPEVALAGDPEREVGALRDELVGQDLPARSHHSDTVSSRKTVARWSFGFSSSAGSR